MDLDKLLETHWTPGDRLRLEFSAKAVRLHDNKQKTVNYVLDNQGAKDLKNIVPLGVFVDRYKEYWHCRFVWDSPVGDALVALSGDSEGAKFAVIEDAPGSEEFLPWPAGWTMEEDLVAQGWLLEV